MTRFGDVYVTFGCGKASAMEEKNKGGRPRKPDQPTHAERQRAYRARVNAKLADVRQLERVADAARAYVVSLRGSDTLISLEALSALKEAVGQ